MKNYFLLALAIIAVLVSGCKNENQNTDPSNPQSTDTGERDYIVRIYMTQDMIDYFNYEVYVTLPNQPETKIPLENTVAPNDTLDFSVLDKIDEVKLDVSDLKVFTYNKKDQKGQAKLRFTLALKDSVELPAKINLIQGYSFNAYLNGELCKQSAECEASKGYNTAGVQEFIEGIDGCVRTFDIK